MINRNLFWILLTFLISDFCLACTSRANEPSQHNLPAAKQAYYAANATKAHTLFKNIWDDKGAIISERLEAGRYLVKIDWRLFGNIEKAYKTLRELEQIKEEVSLTFSLRARILRNEGKFKDAIYWSKKALDSSESEIQKFKASNIYGKSVLDLVKEELFTSGSITAKTGTELEMAHARLKTILGERQDSYDLAKLYLGHSLFLGKGEEALKAWRLFFRLKEGDRVHPTLITSAANFEKTLLSFNPENTDKGTLNALIKGLAESGFLEYAFMLKEQVFGKGPQPDKDILALGHFYEYIQRLEKRIDRYYRKMVRDNTKAEELRDLFNEEGQWLWDRLEWSDTKPAYSRNQFISTVRKKFKCLILFNTIDQFYGLHIGQIILDDKRTISQYDQSAEFRYTLIDHIISNGFTNWFTDGENSVGGWATSQGAFVQVREGLNREISQTWSFLRDPVESKKIQDQIKRMSANEDEMARKNPYGYLPGLQYRLIGKACQEILDSLENTGLDEKKLRYTFIRYMEKIAQDAKIYAHEGRHSIDMKYNFTSGSANLEYTAKLSEVYFSEKPLFFLATLLSSNMGNGTAHGDANLRLAKNMVKWMEANQSEIAGFDASRPTLPQIELLSDTQVRKAIRSFDPMAN